MQASSSTFHSPQTYIFINFRRLLVSGVRKVVKDREYHGTEKPRRPIFRKINRPLSGALLLYIVDTNLWLAHCCLDGTKGQPFCHCSIGFYFDRLPREWGPLTSAISFASAEIIDGRLRKWTPKERDLT